MQVPIFGKVPRIRFLGQTDPSLWLDIKNGEHSPLLIPLWPADFPAHVAVYLSEALEVGVALTRDTMLTACRSLLQEEPVLWFCNIPLEDLLAATDADPKLFS